MFFNRSTLKASLIAIAVSTGTLFADEIVNEEFSQAITSTASVFNRRIEDSESTLIKIQGLKLNGYVIPLSTIWTNEIINELSLTYREVAIQPANFQQLTGQQSAREFEHEYILVGEVTSGTGDVLISVQLIDVDRESVIAAKNVTLERTQELIPLLISAVTSGSGVADFFEPDGQDTPNMLTLGEITDGHTLTEDDEDWYQFTAGEVPSQVTATTDSHIDTYITVYGPNSTYSFISDDDDGGNDNNASVSFVTEPGSTYYVAVRGYDYDATGAYSLRTISEEYVLPEDEPNNSVSSAYSIEYGEDYESGLMPSGDEDYYSIDLPDNLDESSMITFQTRSNMDTKIAIYNADGTYISENDDSGEGDNGLISIPVGSHESLIVRVFPYSSDEGNYTLVHEVEEASEVEFGEVFNGSLSSSNGSDLIRIELPESISGSNITIETESMLDTKIALYNEAGESLVDDDDSGEDSNALVSWSVSGGEVFFVEVTPYGSDDYGSYRLVHTIQ